METNRIVEEAGQAVTKLRKSFDEAYVKEMERLVPVVTNLGKVSVNPKADATDRIEAQVRIGRLHEMVNAYCYARDKDVAELFFPEMFYRRPEYENNLGIAYTAQMLNRAVMEYDQWYLDYLERES